MSQCKGTAFAQPAHLIHEQCFQIPWRESEFADLLKLPTTRLWMNEDALLLCSHVLDEMEVLTVGVLPHKRRQGIANDLFQELFKYAQEHQVHKIFLEVADDNTPAIALYQKMGFRLMNRRAGYYQQGKQDALIYVKEMK